MCVVCKAAVAVLLLLVSNGLKFHYQHCHFSVNCRSQKKQQIHSQCRDAIFGVVADSQIIKKVLPFHPCENFDLEID